MEAAEDQVAMISLGNLRINFGSYQVAVNGRAVHLSFQEFELLTILVNNRDRVIASEAITDGLWSGAGRAYVRRLNVLVHRLRAKLAPSKPYRIESVRGRGYGLLSSTALSAAGGDSVQ